MSTSRAAEFSHEIPRLLGVLGRGSEGLNWPEGEWDWKPFARACDDHQVTAFVYCRLKNMRGTAPPDLLEHLRRRFYAISARNYALAKKLVDLTSLLQGEGIPVLAYKGPAVAMAVYGDLTLRQYTDLDVVVRKEDLVKAVRVLTSRGFEPQPSFGRPQMTPYWCRPENPRHVGMAQEIPFRAPDKTYFVDLHWQLGYAFWRPFGPDVEGAWNRVAEQDIGPGRVSTFCREDLFLALCYHGTTHRWGILKWMLDIAQLLQEADKFDWSRIEEMIRDRPGARASASLGVLLAHEMLEAPIPVEALRILPATSRIHALAAAIREEILLYGKSSGSDHATLLQLETNSLVLLKYYAVWLFRYPVGLFREVFVQVNSKDRAIVALPGSMRYLYHLIRPLRLAVKHSLRVVRELGWTAGRTKVSS